MAQHGAAGSTGASEAHAWRIAHGASPRGPMRALGARRMSSPTGAGESSSGLSPAAMSVALRASSMAAMFPSRAAAEQGFACLPPCGGCVARGNADRNDSVHRFGNVSQVVAQRAGGRGGGRLSRLPTLRVGRSAVSTGAATVGCAPGERHALAGRGPGAACRQSERLHMTGACAHIAGEQARFV